jgi:hypothetical protein
MTDRICPTCGQPKPGPTSHDDIDASDALILQFQQICVEHGYVVRAGRVSESVAAELLGMRKLLLANRRRSGNGPRAFHIPIDGSRYSYELRELAAWQSNHGIGDQWV